MFKIHFGKEGHSLTQEDYDYLASKTDGFSGSDISGLVKQALMIPVSRMQKSDYFYLKVDPAHPEKGPLYYPCQANSAVFSLYEYDNWIGCYSYFSLWYSFW